MKAYPVPGKKKSADLCQAFIDGAGDEGRASDAAVFYGVTDANYSDWLRVKAEGREFYYIDNSYFDGCRGTHFRVTRNRLQHDGRGGSNGVRLTAMGVTVKPWKQGKHIVVCPQSDLFMRLMAGYPGNWTTYACNAISQVTKRHIIVRGWQSDKVALSGSLVDDLSDAWALVTWSSAAAVMALLEGVPVFVGTPDCAAFDFAGWGLRHIESPRRPHGRETWAAVLADNQWTIEELANGTAWRMLCAQRLLR